MREWLIAAPDDTPAVFVADWAGSGVVIGADALGDGERRHLSGVPAWRCQQWSRGRVSARAALSELGLTAAGIEVLSGPRGAPLVIGGPASLRLSISHAGPLVAIAVGNRLVGVDIEEIDEKTIILARRLTPAAATERPPEHVSPAGWITLLHALWEAAYKAQGPALTWRDCQMHLTGDGGVTLVQPSGDTLRGHFRMVRQHVLVAVCKDPTAKEGAEIR